MEFAPEVLDKLADALHNLNYLQTPAEIDERIRAIVAQAKSSNQTSKGSFGSAGGFSITRAIRGLVFKSQPGIWTVSERQNLAVDREGDIGYAERTLLTGTTPGSYLVPTIQADSIIGLLTSANVIRKAGARIWPMNGIQKLNVPVATAAPTVVWGNSAGTGAGGQGVQLTPSDQWTASHSILHNLAKLMKSSGSSTRGERAALAHFAAALARIDARIRGP